MVVPVVAGIMVVAVVVRVAAVYHYQRIMFMARIHMVIVVCVVDGAVIMRPCMMVVVVRVVVVMEYIMVMPEQAVVMMVQAIPMMLLRDVRRG